MYANTGCAGSVSRCLTVVHAERGHVRVYSPTCKSRQNEYKEFLARLNYMFSDRSFRLYVNVDM